MRAFFVGVLFGLMFGANAAAAKCTVTGLPSRTAIGAEYPSDWIVPSGGYCRYIFWAYNYAIYAVEFPVKPKHGSVGTAERYAAGYHAKDGYVGPDSFVIAVIIQRDGKPGMFKVNVNVNVVKE